MFTLINPWAVLVAGVAAYLVGWAWYSPILWQKPWMSARGDSGENRNESGRKEMPKLMLYGLINTLLMSFVIAVFTALTDASTLMEYLQVSLLACFGFVVTVKFNDMLYTAYPPHYGRRAQIMFFVDVGYQIALFIVVGAILWYMSH